MPRREPGWRQPRRRACVWRSNPVVVTPPIPIRSAYFGATFGVLGVVAVLVFASSLNHLDTTPRFSGYTWDFSAVENGSDTCNANPVGITRALGVTDLAGVCVQDIQLDGQPVSALAFHHIRGTIQPSIVKGRAPQQRA